MNICMALMAIRGQTVIVCLWTPKKPLSATDKRIAAARGGLDNVEAEGRTAAERQIVARLEPLIKQAAKEGRMEDAEAYLIALKSLVPDYGK